MFQTVQVVRPRRRQNLSLYYSIAFLLEFLYISIILFIKTDIIFKFDFFKGSLPEINIENSMSFDLCPIYYQKKFTHPYDHSKNNYYIKNAGGHDLHAWVYMARSSTERLRISYYVIENVYVNSAGGWTFDNIEVQYPQSIAVPRFNSKNGQVRRIENDVIALGNGWCRVFAHFVYDVLAYLVFIPIDIRKRAKFLLLSHSEIYREMVTHFDIPNENIEYIGNDFVFALKLHTVIAAEPIHGAMIRGIPAVREVFRKDFNCDSIESKYLGLYNRAPNQVRHILEFDEFEKHCREKLESIIPILRISDYSTLKEAVTTYASLKILLGPTGSGLSNMIYMRPKTGIVCCLGDLNDPPVEACAEVLEMWLITVRVPGMEHHGNQKGSLPHDITIKAIKNVLYAVKHQKWEHNHLQY